MTPKDETDQILDELDEHRAAGMTCPCGTDHGPALVNAMIILAQQAGGPSVPITTPRGTWLVPRIYVAVHGLRASELPALAERYGWPRHGD